MGEKKFYNLPNSSFLSSWIKRPKANKNSVVPLKNSISVATAEKTKMLTKWSDNAFAYMYCDANDLQNASVSTALLSSTYFKGHGFYVTKEK